MKKAVYLRIKVRDTCATVECIYCEGCYGGWGTIRANLGANYKLFHYTLTLTIYGTVPFWPPGTAPLIAIRLAPVMGMVKAV